MNKAGVILAHPDDETLWAGGIILSHSQWEWLIYTLCKADDPVRAANFHQAIDRLKAIGKMANLEDGPAQLPQYARGVSQRWYLAICRMFLYRGCFGCGKSKAG